MAKDITAPKKVVTKKAEEKKEVEKVVEVKSCKDCNGTGLLDAHNLCPECNGSGQK